MKNSLKKPSSRKKSKSPELVSGNTSQNPEGEDDDDESLLEPEELLRRARSKLLEDLSEGAGVSGEKGVLTLPHSLSKYKEVSWALQNSCLVYFARRNLFYLANYLHLFCAHLSRVSCSPKC
jgi:hypothetical protein